MLLTVLLLEFDVELVLVVESLFVGEVLTKVPFKSG